MEFTQVIESRYSCKNFSARQLTPAQLDAILAAGSRRPPKTCRSSASMSSSLHRGWLKSTLQRLAVTAHRPALW